VLRSPGLIFTKSAFLPVAGWLGISFVIVGVVLLGLYGSHDESTQ